MTKVVNIKTQECDVKIDRTTKWGNPFKVGVDGTQDEVIKKHLIWIKTKPHLMNSLHELKGKRLGCWCAPLPCHGDNLIKLLEEFPCSNDKSKE